MAGKKLLTPNELAQVLQVSTTWVYSRSRTRKKSGFPVRKVGKYIRFSVGEVLNWLKDQSEGGAE